MKTKYDDGLCPSGYGVRRARGFVLIVMVAMLATVSFVAQAFQHPGIGLTLTDLSNLKTNITKLPWATGYSALVADGHSSTNYTEQGPFTYVNRNNGGNYDHEAAWESDMTAVYDLARMWYFTGDANYAQKSHDILISWAITQTNYGGIEAAFDLGDYAYRYAGGADILRSTWPGWTASDTATVQNYFNSVFWVDLGIPNPVASGSQGMEDLIAATAIAVFNDDTNKFNQTLSAFLADADAGFRDTYANGEMGDTGRDQGHAGLYLYDLAWPAEVFWKQGVDVFSIYDNRIHACGEYYTRYNGSLQTNLPFAPLGAPFWGVFTTIGGSPWGGLNSMARNILHAAYTERLGIDTPYVDIFGLSADEDGFMYYKTADSSTATSPTIASLPATASVTTGLTGADLNGNSPAGSSSYSGGTWTLQGGYNGGDPWYGGNDTVQFAYAQVTGDFTFIAKVDSVSNVGAGNAKAGIMMRDSLGNASERVYVAMTPNNTCERVMYGWTSGGLPYGNNAAAESFSSLQIPYWVKMERVGNRIQTYTSINGGDWSPAGTADYGNLPTTVYLGLFDTSMVGGTLNTATFSNVSITGGDNGEPLQTPPAPFAIYASPGAGQVPLHWNESFSATSFNVLRSTTSGGSYATIAIVTNTSYVDANVTPGTTYYYVVTASNPAGTSGYSHQDSATTIAIPAAPSTPVIVSGNNSLRLTWSTSGGASSYNIKRASTSGGPYSVVGNTILASYVDTGLANGTTYYYVVSAVNAAGESGNSAQASGAPTVTTAIDINFEGGGPNGTPAVMQSSEYAGYVPVNNWNTAAGVSGTVGSLVQSDGTVTSGSVNWSCNNTWSIVIGDVPGDYRMMMGYLDTSATSTTTVTVSGLPSAYTANGYDVYVYCDGDNGSTTKTGVYTIGSTTIQATDNGGMNFSGTFVQANNSPGNFVVFANQTTSSFTLSAHGLSTDSGPRGPINGIQIVANSAVSLRPAAPAGLSAAGGNTVVNLNWTQSTSSGITGNNIYRSTSGSGGPYNLLANLSATTSYSDTAVLAGNTYFYAVTATNANGESALSAYAGATTIPAVPTGLTATPGNNQVALRWSTSTGASSYNVKRAAVSGGPFTTIASGVTAISYTDTAVTNGTTYYYVVSAVNGTGESANSSQVSATPSAPGTPASPTSLTASAGRKKVTLTWTQSTSPNITTNNVYRATVNGGPYAKVVSIAATTTYADTGLTTGTTYYYVVTAVNSSGLGSPYSNQASATAK